MKKTAIFLAVVLVLSMLVLSSCDFVEQMKPEIDSMLHPCVEHVDADNNHDCDVCGEQFITDCVAAEGTHYCSVCGKKRSKCQEVEGSHDCAICGKALSECVEEVGSHNCPICDKALSECETVDGSHICVECGEAVSECADEDKNHKCDICGKTTSECAAGQGSHSCPVCEKVLSECDDADKDHKCNVCGATMGEHKANDGSHICGYCGLPESECVDLDKDHKCNVCGETVGEHKANEGSHDCTYCGKAVSECTDEGKDHKCDICGETVGEHKAEGSHTCAYCGQTMSECGVADNKHSCDICGKVYSECADADKDHKCEICGATMGEHKEAEGSHICTYCGQSTSECAAPAGSHSCPVCGLVYSECADADSDGKCDVCGSTIVPDTHEQVTYELNIGDLVTGVRAEDEILGKFTIVSGTEVRNRTKTYNGVEYTKSVKMAAGAINVSVPGEGKLSFIVQNGSSGAAVQYVKITAPDGTVSEIAIPGTDEGSPTYLVELDVTEGQWSIQRVSGTIDVFYLSLTCMVEKSDENGFELVSAGKVDYITNQTLDVGGVKLNSTFANGKTDSLDIANVNVDTSAVDMTTAGTYPIVLSYKEYAPITIYVNVFAPESIKLEFDAVEKLPQNTSYGNGVYYNHSWKNVYVIGEELDTSGLSVIVVAVNGDKTLEFRVDDYTITGFDSSYTDIINLTISAYGVEAKTEVHITDTNPTANEAGVYMLLVDPAYLGIAGALSGPYHVFSTIQGALDYAAHIEAGATKELYIAPGLYNEKLEIEVPNLKIVGWGSTPDEVVIEWDSLYGLVDAGGFTHTTDSTQTVAIRESAYNVTIENITISNYWNSQDRMNAAGLGIERGLALLVQADRFTMKNSRLLGIQDTLELFTGRQYFENVFISGYTDFIFGTNNATIFKNCTIHVIDTEKDDKGTAGYITAFKGSNKGAQDSIVYGAIFDGCKFTADEGVTVGCTAIGRTWGAYAAVAVINSELGEHISTAGYDKSENKNKRYISMNGIHPTDETVQFVEYNNTGAGAITEAVAGMRFLTAEEAAKYVDFATVFGTINGNVSFLDPWNPDSTEVIVDDRTYYYFDGTEGTSGESYTYTENIQGTTLEWAGMFIDATKGKVTRRDSDTQINAGAKLIFNVKAGTLVTVKSYPGYGNYTINGIAHSANDTFSMYFAEDTEVVIEATATSYIHQVIINPNEEAPEAATITELVVSGMVVDYLVGDALNLEGISVNLHYSDKSVRPATDYTIDTSAVNVNAPGEYVVVFTCGDFTANVTVTYVGDFTITESTTIDLSATGVHIEGGKGTYKVLEIDATNGKFSDNGGGWAQVNTGTIISFKVAEGAQVSVVAYNSADNFDIVVANGVCTITAVGNDYLKSIAVNIVFVYSESTTIDLSATGANIQGGKGTYQGLEVDATNGKFADNGSGWVQVNAGTVITFNVLEGAQVSVTAYSNVANFDIAVANGVCTITVVGNDYLKAISIKYAIVYGENTTIDLSATGANIQGGKGTYQGLEVDATNGKFADNGSGWVQVNAGTVITFNVLEGAQVSVTAYSNVANFDIAVANGVCTITVVGNDYLKAIIVDYSVVEEPAHECEHVCAECGKCTDAACEDTACAEKCEGHTVTPEEVTHVFNPSTDLENFGKGDKADGETTVIGDFFTIHFGKNSVVEDNAKTFEDGFTSTKRFTLGGSATPGTSGKCCVEFTVTATSTVKIWWVSGGDNRQMTIFDASKNVICKTETSVKNTLYCTEFTVEAGTYFIGGDTGSNYIYKVEVSAGSSAEAPEVPAHECEHVCAECGKCTDAACEENACAEKCEGHEEAPVVPEEVTHVFNPSTDLDVFAKGEKADKETQVIGDFFTIHYGKNSVVEENAKTFEDGFTSTKRFTLGGSATPGTSGKCCVEFTVTATSTVKIWWISGGDNRQMTIFDANKNVICKTETSIKNALYCTEFTVEAGTYFIGGDEGSNYIYKVEVSTSK